MFKLYATSIFLTFLAIKTYSLGIPDTKNVLSNFQTSDASVTKFSSNGYSLTPGRYQQIHFLRPTTCSVRVDFHKFSFNQPTKVNGTSAYMCDTQQDIYEISVTGEQLFKLPYGCGDLTGHHVYLAIKNYDDTTLDSIHPKLLIHKVNYVGSNGQLSEKPSWDVTTTQIPCSGKSEVKQLQNVSLPPIGCIQYFTEKEGIFESYNYFNGKGHYIGELDYSVCFKRYSDTCGIKFTAVDFELPTNGGNTSTERDCDTPNPNADKELYQVTNGDNILIPNGVSIIDGSKVFASKYCGNSLKNREVIIKKQGPLSIQVITDSVCDPLDKERGFKIKFQLLTEC